MFTSGSLALTIITGSCLFIVWSLPFIIFLLLGIRLFKITNKRQIPMIFSRISKTCSYTEDGDPRGWIFGKYYIGYIMEHSSDNRNGKSYSIFILCTNKYFKDLTDPTSKTIIQKQTITYKNNEDEESDKKKIKFYERNGNYFYLHYNSRDINVEKYVPRSSQKKIIDSLKDDYKKNGCVVSVIYGDPGSGKSMIPILLTKEINGYLCDSYNPTDPGDDIALIYNTIMPTYEKPLVIVFEEFDIMITKIHNNIIQPHKHIPIQVKDKTSWNILFDRIDRGLYPNMFILLTSNLDPIFIDKLDSSYLRPGRISSRYKL